MTLKLGLGDSALQERRAGIGGSDARVVVHGTPEERYALWQEKVGEKKPKKIMSDWAYALRAVTEELQLDWYEHIHAGSKIVERGAVRVSHEHRFMRCTLDGFVLPLNVPINCKHVSRWTKEAREWCIEHYTPQVTHEAIVCHDADYGLLSLLHGEKEPEILRIDVDPFYREHLIAREAEFWQAVVDGVPPADCLDLDTPKAATPVARRRNVDLNGGTWSADGQTLVADPKWPNYALDMIELFGTFERTHDAAVAHAICRESIKKLVPEDVGLIARGKVELKQDGRGITIALRKETDG